MIIVEVTKSRGETVERGSERSTRTRSSEMQSAFYLELLGKAIFSYRCNDLVSKLLT